jgi:phosphate acetyltransferase
LDFGKLNATGIEWTELKIGDGVETERKVTPKDLFSYLGFSDDRNPLYYQESYAAQTEYKHVIVPPGLLAGWIAALVSAELPGPGSVVKEMKLSFPNALHLDESVRIRLTVLEKTENPRTLTLSVLVSHEDRPVTEGELVVTPPAPLRSFNDAFENF